MSDSLTDDMIGYCLVRETDTFDSSVTVKFVFVFWLGDHANRMQKARTSTHIGFIKSFIGVRVPILAPWLNRALPKTASTNKGSFPSPMAPNSHSNPLSSIS